MKISFKRLIVALRSDPWAPVDDPYYSYVAGCP
jgi:hypothetical protein